MDKHERKARLAAAMILHGIARPYFGYPALEDSWWYLPTVRRWEPWQPLPSAPPRTRTERRLVGSLIVPSLVRFPIEPSVYLTGERRERFSLHLRTRTGSRWDIDYNTQPLGFVQAERLAYVVTYENTEGTTHYQAMPASPSSKPPRERLHAVIWRGLWGGWDNELPASGYSADEAPRSLDMPTVRKALPEPPGYGQPFADMLKEIEDR